MPSFIKNLVGNALKFCNAEKPFVSLTAEESTEIPKHHVGLISCYSI